MLKQVQHDGHYTNQYKKVIVITSYRHPDTGQDLGILKKRKSKKYAKI